MIHSYIFKQSNQKQSKSIDYFGICIKMISETEKVPQKSILKNKTIMQQTDIEKNNSKQDEDSESLSMTDLYFKDDFSNINFAVSKGIDYSQNLETKQPCLSTIQPVSPIIEEKKNQHDIFNEVSFSKFERISQTSEEDAQIHKPQGQEIENQLLNSNMKKKGINKVPTSTKIISSKKLIQKPIQVMNIDQQYAMPNINNQASKHEYEFNYNYLSTSELFEKFSAFAKQKGMVLNVRDNEIFATLKVPIYITALSLCFPNSQFEHQVYHFSSPTKKMAKISQLSGDDQKYYNFREQFLTDLWLDKYLVSGSLHQNIRHFIRFANSPKNSFNICSFKNKQLDKGMGQIDEVKKMIQKTIKNSNQKKLLNKDQSPQLLQMKKNIKQMEQNLKIMLQKEMKRQEYLKLQRQKSIKKDNQIRQSADRQSVQRTKLFVTPAVERMLLTILYHHLTLDEVVKKYVIGYKEIGDFEKKKLIIKASLCDKDIFKYLQLEQFYNLFESQRNKDSTLVVLPQSKKILSSLNYSNYPSPTQILQMISIFKNTLTKEINTFNFNRVKVQDHNNQQKTFLQFWIYCIIMCQNRDLLATVETANIFCDLQDERSQDYYNDSLRMVDIFKKAISFVRNQWEL